MLSSSSSSNHVNPLSPCHPPPTHTQSVKGSNLTPSVHTSYSYKTKIKTDGTILCSECLCLTIITLKDPKQYIFFLNDKNFPRFADVTDKNLFHYTTERVLVSRGTEVTLHNSTQSIGYIQIHVCHQPLKAAYLLFGFPFQNRPCQFCHFLQAQARNK